MGAMTNTTTITDITTDTTCADSGAMPERSTVQQLSLLPAAEVPLQFRLDAATRRRGLRHVAQIRQLLAERQAAREHERRAPRSTAREHRAA
jgi:hypothetical protein